MQSSRNPARWRRAAATIATMVHESDPHGRKRDAWLARVASAQWGNVTTAQLRRAGFTEREIRGMARRSELLRRHRGVWAVGHLSPAPEARWAAALLAAGAGAALSHTAAVAVRGLLAPRGVTEVTAPGNRRGDAALRVHRGQLAGEDVTVLRGLPVTTVARTLVDLAAAGWPIGRLTHDLAAAGHASLDDLRAYAGASRRKGVAALRRALAMPHTRSAGERRLLRGLQQRGLPLPQMNAPISRMTVDAFFEELGLVVEVDHDQTHGTAYAIERDERRDAELRRRGLRVRRVRA